MKKVYFLDTVHSVLNERLSNANYNCIDATKENIEELREILSDAYGIVLRSRFTLNQEILSFCPKLKFIARSGSGLENIDLEYCVKNQIDVYSSPEGNRKAVAEHCLGFCLSLLNNFKGADNDINNGEWLREKNRGSELSSQCVGIIGYGNNGKEFAQALNSLNVPVLAHDKYKTGFSEGVIKESSIEEIFQKATLISFHVPLTEETAYMADYQFFKRFKAPVLVINISRGKILKTKDLINALDEGFVLGAALDVLDEESKSFTIEDKNNVLVDLNNRPNVIITPHVAGWTKESYFKLSNVLADKIIK
jgi:D-3-phosphoglycerate dehydrogenase